MLKTIQNTIKNLVATNHNNTWQAYLTETQTLTIIKKTNVTWNKIYFYLIKIKNLTCF